jgi:N-acetylglutamate synthase and related acetyltransferases
VRIEPLTKDHDSSNFDCGEDSLNKYLKTFALQARSMGLSRTFVAIEDNSNKILGYYTRLPSSVLGESIPEARSRNPVPVMLLGKLAVTNGLQRGGVGKRLLKHFLESVIAHAENEACFAVTVDALDQRAKEYYAQFGFKEFQDTSLSLYLPMKIVRKLTL